MKLNVLLMTVLQYKLYLHIKRNRIRTNSFNTNNINNNNDNESSITIIPNMHIKDINQKKYFHLIRNLQFSKALILVWSAWLLKILLIALAAATSFYMAGNAYISRLLSVEY